MLQVHLRQAHLRHHALTCVACTLVFGLSLSCLPQQPQKVVFGEIARRRKIRKRTARAREQNTT